MDYGIAIGVIIGSALSALVLMIARGVTLKNSGGGTVQNQHALTIDNACKGVEALIASCRLDGLDLVALRNRLDGQIADLGRAVDEHQASLDLYHRKYVQHLLGDYRRFLRSLDDITTVFVNYGASLSSPDTLSDTPSPRPTVVQEDGVLDDRESPLQESAIQESAPPPADRVDSPEPVPFTSSAIAFPPPSRDEELPTFEQQPDEEGADTNTYVELDSLKLDTDTSEVVDRFMAPPTPRSLPAQEEEAVHGAAFEPAVPPFDPASIPEYLPAAVSDDTEQVKDERPSQAPALELDPATLGASSAAVEPQETPAQPPHQGGDSEDISSAESFIFSGGDAPAGGGLFDTDIADISQIAPDYVPPAYKEDAPPTFEPPAPPPSPEKATQERAPADATPPEPDSAGKTAEDRPGAESSIITGDDLLEKMDSFFQF